MSTEQEQDAKASLLQALKDSQDAAFEAGIAVPFLEAKFSERRRLLAEEAQAAAHEASEHAQLAEHKFYAGDYSAVIEASRQTRDCLEKAREKARLAAIDESDLYRCPNCMTKLGRFSARAEYLPPLSDGSRHWMKRFQCFHCHTRWREVYTAANDLIERTIE